MNTDLTPLYNPIEVGGEEANVCEGEESWMLRQIWFIVKNMDFGASLVKFKP